MSAIVDWLKGKKTYIVAIATAVYGLGIQLGWWVHSIPLDAVLGGAGMAALRAGITNETTSSTPAKP